MGDLATPGLYMPGLARDWRLVVTGHRRTRLSKNSYGVPASASAGIETSRSASLKARRKPLN